VELDIVEYLNWFEDFGFMEFKFDCLYISILSNQCEFEIWASISKLGGPVLCN
jgi:hypothetical protein